MSYDAKLIKGGKVVVPAAVRRKLGVSPGDVLIFEEDGDGRIVLKTYEQVVREVQEQFDRMLPPGVSMREELFKERRREFELEQRDLGELTGDHRSPQP